MVTRRQRFWLDNGTQWSVVLDLNERARTVLVSLHYDGRPYPSYQFACRRDKLMDWLRTGTFEPLTIGQLGPATVEPYLGEIIPE